jgi:hypothetical protein
MQKAVLQPLAAISSVEAELALEMAIEILYPSKLLSNMGFQEGLDTPVYKDNTACIEWGNHSIGGQEPA